MLSIWYIFRKFSIKFKLNVLALVIFIGCSAPQIKKKDSYVYKDSETTHTGNEAQIQKANKETYLKSKKIVYVADNGMARSFAHVGALKEINKNNIQISSIVGVGFGALIGALYSESNNLNEFEWKVLKLRNDVFKESFISKKLNFSEVQRRTKRITEFLDEVFGDKKTSDLKIPMYFGYKDQEKFIVLRNDKVKKNILLALSDGVHFELRPNNKKTNINMQSIGEFSRSINQGVVLYVNTDGEKNNKMAMFSDFYLSPHLSDIDKNDFIKSNTISYRAERDLKEIIRKIQKKLSIEL